MKLYNVPNNTRVRVAGTETIVNFHHIDGMYSLCTLDNGDITHLHAWQEVEIVDKPKDNVV